MLEMNLRQLGFTYNKKKQYKKLKKKKKKNTKKNKERIQKFKETGDSRYICKNSRDKVCFQHEMSYRDL